MTVFFGGCEFVGKKTAIQPSGEMKGIAGCWSFD